MIGSRSLLVSLASVVGSISCFGFESIDYDRICLYLTEIAKVQRREIEDMRSENKLLRERLDRLEERIGTLPAGDKQD